MVYWLARGLLAVLLLVLGPVKVRGKHNVPRRGGLLVVANHLSDCDPPVIGHALPRKAHYMAKAELFKIPVLSWVIRALQAFPVSRGTADRAAIRHSVDLLQSGEAVVVFPEGQLSEDGALQPLLPGAAMIAARAGVPILCARLVGTTRIMPFKSVIPRPAFGGVSIAFGKPRSFPPHTAPQEILDWMTAELSASPKPETG